MIDGEIMQKDVHDMSQEEITELLDMLGAELENRLDDRCSNCGRAFDEYGRSDHDPDRCTMCVLIDSLEDME